ncbi:transmembrane protein 183 [Uranotaenia lowii]|uniref:transmembrane protein 183 n=1 Tax=Uranotaenia lowii TaxID=190385 RepID=UPI002478748E|nr:transmembrane protein 183 [Uranotaenia lowii]
MAVCIKLKSRSGGPSQDFSIYEFAHSGKKNIRNKANKLVIDTADNVALDEDELAKMASSEHPESTTDQTVQYADYVIDIWFLISNHIRPEDTCRFALICRKTAEVIQSAQFWLALYRRHYDRNVELPRRLQPECMSLLRGLRPRIIRSLFYMYAPFVHRIESAPFSDPHRITGKRLLFSWSVKTRTGWNYYFKLKARLIPGSRTARSEYLQQSKECLSYLQDIYANLEEGGQILVISSDVLTLVPQYHDPVYVKSLTQTLAQGLTKYKVRLQMANYCGRILDETIFVPVRQVQLLDWWNPEYYRQDPTMQEDSVKVSDNELMPELEATDDNDRAMWDEL